MTPVFRLYKCLPHGDTREIDDSAVIDSVAMSILARYGDGPQTYLTSHRGEFVQKPTFGIGERRFVSIGKKTHVAEITGFKQ